MRFFGLVQYDGTNFIGWQVQPEGRSVQAEIEKALSQILNTPIRINGSGRTDAGVHAFGQTFHFDTEKPILDTGRFKYSVNCVLPKDIHILRIEPVADNFHARYDVTSKTYIYSLNTGEYDVFNRHHITQFLRPLDVERMKELTQYFIGEHCFKNFTTKEEDKNDYIRTITEFEIVEINGLITFRIKGSGFMRYMVRLIVGTLIEVGLGKLTKDDILDYLTNDERSVTPYKAPPEGLILVRVEYGEHEDA